MAIETLRGLAQQSGHADLPVPPRPRLIMMPGGPRIQAYGGLAGIGGGYGYNGASQSARMSGWQGSISGPNTINLCSWEELVRRSRDAVRNFPVATTAMQKWVSNIIGSGIRANFTHPDPNIRLTIQRAWDKWTKRRNCDFEEHISFYGHQEMAARALFQTGETFVRYHIIDDPNSYFQIQQLETEQVPVYVTMQNGPWPGSVIREGVIYNANKKRVGYHIYRAQPYDSVVNPLDATQYTDVSADYMEHVFDMLRPGQIRGVSMLAPILPLLWDIEGYADATRLRNRLAALIAFFIEKPSIDSLGVMPGDATGPLSSNNSDKLKLEPGTAIDLLPGEKVNSPQVPNTVGYAEFMTCELRKLAGAVGLTAEMITGDYSKVNYSSARVALLEFRRQAEAYQQHVIIDQFCEPIMSRWMREAVLAGALDLPNDYADDPDLYEACDWVPDGWQFVDPAKEATAAMLSVRGGFISRSRIIRQNGFDPATIEAEIATERQREQDLGIVTDSNANVVLAARETLNVDNEKATPTEESEHVQQEDDTSGE